MLLFILVALVCAALILTIGAWLGSELGGASFVVALVIWLALAVFFYWLSFGTESTESLTFTKLERIADGDGGKWLAHTDDETFENTDAWYHGKTDATDLQRELKTGVPYRCEVNGVRFSVLSMYRNVLACEPAVR